MFDVADTLLPATATPLAKALDILEERLFDLPVHFVSKDPWTVDVSLLDHLAWEYSVDVWDMQWPDDIKRRIIAISSEVHRYKGTPYAVKAALAGFDVDAELLEWWEPTGVAENMENGTVLVRASATRALYPFGGTASAQTIDALTAVLHRVLPVSRRLTLRVSERITATVGVAAGVRTRTISRDPVAPLVRPVIINLPLSIRSGVRDIIRDRAVISCLPRGNSSFQLIAQRRSV